MYLSLFASSVCAFSRSLSLSLCVCVFRCLPFHHLFFSYPLFRSLPPFPRSLSLSLSLSLYIWVWFKIEDLGQTAGFSPFSNFSLSLSLVKIGGYFAYKCKCCIVQTNSQPIVVCSNPPFTHAM